MAGPVVDWQERMVTACGLRSPFLLTTMLALVALVVLPLLLVATAAGLSRHWGRLTANGLQVATRYSYALVPLGFGMWLAHYSYHFLTSYASVLPTTQRFVASLGYAGLGSPRWSCACCAPVADWLIRLQIVFLECGLLLSLYAGYRISLAQVPHLRRALRAFAPWAVLMLGLFILGIWIVFQPMPMRGMLEMTP
jgi:hypothetical protein